LLSIMNTGKPEVIFSITVTCQFPRSAFGHVVPTVTKLLALAEGQIINDAGSKAVVQIDLRESPVQFLVSG